MRKIFCLVICLLALALCTPQKVSAAESQWVRVTDDNVNFYATANASKPMFTLAKSYYLEVIGEEAEMYRVTVMQNEQGFPKISGYVWKSQVTECITAPVTPHYPTEKIYVTASSSPLKLSPVPSSDTVLMLTNTQQMSYYGQIVNYGTTWYFVCYCDTLGYIDASSVTTPTIALHPTPLPKPVTATPQPTEPQPETPTPEPTRKVNITEILLIIFVGLFSVGISLALFLPARTKKDAVWDQEI